MRLAYLVFLVTICGLAFLGSLLMLTDFVLVTTTMDDEDKWYVVVALTTFNHAVIKEVHIPIDSDQPSRTALLVSYAMFCVLFVAQVLIGLFVAGVYIRLLRNRLRKNDRVLA